MESFTSRKSIHQYLVDNIPELNDKNFLILHASDGNLVFVVSPHSGGLQSLKSNLRIRQFNKGVLVPVMDWITLALNL